MKCLLRILTVSLVPCLIADPAICAGFSEVFTTSVTPAVTSKELFNREAFSVRLIPFLRSLAQNVTAPIYRAEGEAAMFGWGYTREEALNVIRPILRSGNWESVSLHSRPLK